MRVQANQGVRGRLNIPFCMGCQCRSTHFDDIYIITLQTENCQQNPVSGQCDLRIAIWRDILIPGLHVPGVSSSVMTIEAAIPDLFWR
jgi:hypothetical protein